MLDLRNWVPDHSIALEGDWEYVDSLADPATAEDATFRRVPHVWPGGSDGRGYGTASYRLTILLTPDTPPLDIRFSRMLSAYRVLINGQEAARAGTPGPTREQTIPSRKSETIRLTPYGDVVEVTVQLANFRYYGGGFAEAPVLGPAGRADAAARRRTLLEFFVLGGLVTVGLYHLGLATQRPEERSNILFGATAMVLSLRTFLAGNLQADTLMSLFGWEAFTTLLYLTLYAGVVVFTAYCRSVFPAEFHRPVLLGTVGLSAILALGVIVLPSWIYTASLRPYLLFTAGLVVYTVAVAVRAALHRRDGAIVFLTGTLLLAVALIRDATAGSVPTHTSPLLPLGALVFTFFQAVILSNRVSQSMNEVEELLRDQQRLIGENASLKDLTYIDALTDIANRRRFNETLEIEWARGIRHGRPLSLLMIDIDYFKPYNDAYGHGQGDICLQRVAAILSSGLRRTVDFVARYGGEEFAVILPDTDIEGAQSAGEHLRRQVEEAGITHDHSLVAPVVTISVGAATVVPSTTDSPYSLVEHADRALYMAKQQGRNRLVRFVS
ncbi:MAG: diguanylate cyclase domain-containing protein [Spirochaetota bacterium]